ncbi:MAG: winged helix DNA-binding domain-containing protein [Prevotellaceae bacterium]|nr:winged helix DNA-binding domain-containing protein [Prevotellaceae bacterium]
MNNIVALRLRNHLLAAHELKTPREAVAWMGAMQAQDYGMVKWAIGARLPESTSQQVEDALNRGEIIRTHIMRPTWHIVAVEDVHWLMQLTAPRIKPILEGYDKRTTGLSASVILKATDVMLRALQGGNHLTRTALRSIANNAGIAVDNRQVAHVLLHAELDRLVGSGRVTNGKQTYCLLREQAPSPALFDKDEALAKLAARYFRSHGPATLYDFVWWSGLTTGEARRALEFVKPDFACEKIDEQEYICSATSPSHTAEGSATYLLPAFDELLIGYKDRKEMFAAEQQSKAISSNGIFKPFILHNAKIAGTWKKVASKGSVEVKAEYFSPPTSALQKAVDKAATLFKRFSEG